MLIAVFVHRRWPRSAIERGLIVAAPLPLAGFVAGRRDRRAASAPGAAGRGLGVALRAADHARSAGCCSGRSLAVVAGGRRRRSCASAARWASTPVALDGARRAPCCSARWRCSSPGRSARSRSTRPGRTRGAPRRGAALGDPRRPERRPARRRARCSTSLRPDRPDARRSRGPRPTSARPTRRSPRTPTSSAAGDVRGPGPRHRLRARRRGLRAGSPARTWSSTNAHVVAGQDDTTVTPRPAARSSTRRRSTTSPRNDLAILSVAGPRARRRCGSRPTRAAGPRGAVLGYPENGPFTITPARLGTHRRGDQPGLLRARPDPAADDRRFAARCAAATPAGPLVDGDGRGADDRLRRRAGRGPPGGLGRPERGRAPSAIDGSLRARRHRPLRRRSPACAGRSGALRYPR